MSIQIDEFEAPSQFTMEDVKVRVKGWLRGPVGSGYVFKALTEHQITLTKTKHDTKICGISCVLGFVVPLALAIVGIPIAISIGGISGIFALVGIMMLSMGGIMVIGIGMYCLKPQKVVFTIQISSDLPIRIRVHGSGEIQKARYDYTTFRDTIFLDSSPNLSRMDDW